MLIKSQDIANIIFGNTLSAPWTKPATGSADFCSCKPSSVGGTASCSALGFTSKFCHMSSSKEGWQRTFDGFPISVPHLPHFS